MNKRTFIKQRKHKINREIFFPQVRVIGDGVNPQIMKTTEAIDLAFTLDKDLILITETANPPVARIEDYNKFIYQQEKSEKERKKNSLRTETKEIQLSVSIADHDLSTKSRKAREFLEDDNKVKCVIQLKGRQKSMPEQGELVMLKFAEMVSDIGSLEFMPKLDGGRWHMIIKPKK
jgi:translation initiation factor IF-3